MSGYSAIEAAICPSVPDLDWLAYRELRSGYWHSRYSRLNQSCWHAMAWGNERKPGYNTCFARRHIQSNRPVLGGTRENGRSDPGIAETAIIWIPKNLHDPFIATGANLKVWVCNPSIQSLSFLTNLDIVVKKQSKGASDGYD